MMDMDVFGYGGCPQMKRPFKGEHGTKLVDFGMS